MNLTKHWIKSFNDELDLREYLIDRIEGICGYLKTVHNLETEDLIKIAIALNIAIK